MKPSTEPLVLGFLLSPCTPKPARATCSLHPQTCTGLGSSRPALYLSLTDGTLPHPACRQVPPRLGQGVPKDSFIRQKGAEAKGRKLAALRAASLRRATVAGGGLTVTGVGKGQRNDARTQSGGGAHMPTPGTKVTRVSKHAPEQRKTSAGRGRDPKA